MDCRPIFICLENREPETPTVILMLVLMGQDDNGTLNT